MPYTDKYMKVQAIEIVKTEEVKEDENVTVRNSYTTFYTYISPLDIVRFETYAFSDAMTVVYVRYTDPIVVNLDCESFMYMVDKHVSNIIG